MLINYFPTDHQKKYLCPSLGSMSSYFPSLQGKTFPFYTEFSWQLFYSTMLTFFLAPIQNNADIFIKQLFISISIYKFYTIIPVYYTK